MKNVSLAFMPHSISHSFPLPLFSMQTGFLLVFRTCTSILLSALSVPLVLNAFPPYYLMVSFLLSLNFILSNFLREILAWLLNLEHYTITITQMSFISLQSTWHHWKFSCLFMHICIYSSSDFPYVHVKSLKARAFDCQFPWILKCLINICCMSE